MKSERPRAFADSLHVFAYANDVCIPAVEFRRFDIDPPFYTHIYIYI